MTHRLAAPLVCVRPPGWTAATARPFAELLQWAQHAELLGFDGLFVGDRLLAQASRLDQVVYGASMLDATVVLSAIAARTERILLGPLVLVFPYRHPVQLAKTIASLDVVAGGRLVLGAGIGWNQAEFDALGIPMAGRGQRFEDDLADVRRLWRGEAVTGNEHRWGGDGVRVSPLPVRPGGPPVWLASFSPGQALDWPGELPGPARRVLDRVGRLADGWVPLVYSASSKRRLDPATLGRAWDHVVASAQTASRRREDVDFVFSDWCYVLDGPNSRERCQRALSGFFTGDWDEARRTYSIGSADEILTKIHEQTAHIDRVDAYILTPLSDEPDQLDLMRPVARSLRSGGTPPATGSR